MIILLLALMMEDISPSRRIAIVGMVLMKEHVAMKSHLLVEAEY